MLPSFEFIGLTGNVYAACITIFFFIFRIASLFLLQFLMFLACTAAFGFLFLFFEQCTISKFILFYLCNKKHTIFSLHIHTTYYSTQINTKYFYNRFEIKYFFLKKHFTYFINILFLFFFSVVRPKGIQFERSKR